MSNTTRMSCPACHYVQLTPFPSMTVEGRPDAKYESRAWEVENIPLPQFGENMFSANKRVTIYACPNCGALRIKVRLLD